MNRYKYKIQYQDIDGNSKLRLYTLENMILNSAGLNADELGIGVQYLSQQNCTWVLISLALEINYLPTQGETLEVETWIEQNMHALSMRNYRFYVDNRQVGVAHSVWAVIDLTTRAITNIFEQEAFLKIPQGEQVDVSKTPRMMKVAEQSGEWQHEIVYSDIDYNGHCNSCKYLEFMLNSCTPEFLTQPLRVDLRYQHEVKKGEHVKVLFEKKDSQITYEIFTDKGELSANGRIQKLNVQS